MSGKNFSHTLRFAPPHHLTARTDPVELRTDSVERRKGPGKRRLTCRYAVGMLAYPLRLEIRIDKELREAIDREAQAQDRSHAWIIRQALKRYVRDQDPHSKAVS